MPTGYELNGIDQYLKLGRIVDSVLVPESLPPEGSVEVDVEVVDASPGGGSVGFVCGVHNTVAGIEQCGIGIVRTGQATRFYLANGTGSDISGPSIGEGNRVVLRGEYSITPFSVPQTMDGELFHDGESEASDTNLGSVNDTYNLFVGCRNRNGSTPELFLNCKVYRVLIKNGSGTTTYDTNVDGWGTSVGDPTEFTWGDSGPSESDKYLGLIFGMPGYQTAG